MLNGCSGHVEKAAKKTDDDKILGDVSILLNKTPKALGRSDASEAEPWGFGRVAGHLHQTRH